MRSADYGTTWEPVASLPDEIVNLTREIHVDESTLGAPTAWVVVTGQDAFTCPGPRVWTRRLDVEEDWVLAFGSDEETIEGERPLGFGAADCWGALERRGGEIELVEYTSDVGGRTLLTSLHRLTGVPHTESISTEDSGNPGYVARGERGWIFGQRRPVLHSSAVGEPWEILPTAPESVIVADFRGDGSGFACGRGFCAATTDGDREWSTGTMPPNVRDEAVFYTVAALADDTGWAIYESEFLRGGLLRTDDGGDTWNEVHLPIEPTRLRFGPLGRNSNTPDPDSAPEPTKAECPCEAMFDFAIDRYLGGGGNFSHEECSAGEYHASGTNTPRHTYAEVRISVALMPAESGGECGRYNENLARPNGRAIDSDSVAVTYEQAVACEDVLRELCHGVVIGSLRTP